jgi:peptidoglycan/LPS O-acetylase OafA/YrhL
MANARLRGTRFVELDSLRGLASLTVVICHFLLSVAAGGGALAYAPVEAWFRRLARTPFYVLFAGHNAVIFFFVLSGLVLSLPFHAGRPTPYIPFVVRRVCRIWIPYVVSFAVALGAREVFGWARVPELSTWFNGAWQAPVTTGAVLDHLLLVGTFNSCVYDPVYWSLTHEMRISLLFPAVVWLTTSFRWPAVIMAAIVDSVVANAALGHVASPGLADWILTMHYVSMFLLGSLLAKHRGNLLLLYERCPHRWRPAIVGGFILIYTYGRLGHRLLPNLGDLPVSVAAGGLIVTALASGRMQRFLLWRPIVAVGRASYSIYLLHGVVLLSVLHAAYGRAPIVMLFAFGIGLTMAASLAMEKYVESPSIRLGHWATGKLTLDRQTAALAPRV